MRPRPGSAVVDTGIVAGLCGLALAGLRTSYAGGSFLLAGAIGVVLGLAVGLAVARFSRSATVLAVSVAGTYLLAGCPIVAGGQSLGGVVPTLGALRTVAAASVGSWKQLLTTIPPADASGALLAVPLILGLVSASVGVSVARWTTSPIAPCAAPIVALGIVIALGTHEPSDTPLAMAAFTVLAVGWAAIRGARSRSASSGGTRRRSRTLAGCALLAAAAAVATLLAPGLPGADGRSRAVLRDRVVPPFDVSAYPSPLVGFRKYTKDANQLWDQTLFTVSGLPTGSPVRIATLDSYDGAVWGVSNGSGDGSFQRIGSQVAAPTGPTATVRVTIAAAYASAQDTNAWLPDAGSVDAIGFAGSDGTQLAATLRYNLATSSAVVPSRLHAGDVVVLRTTVGTPAVPADPQPFGSPPADNVYQSVIGSRSAVWTKSGADVWSQLQAAATYLRDTGAYSDGGPGETQYLPGHSIGRLTSFLHDPRPVGDSEQYAAAFALIAESVGMPARVVLGAVPEPDGRVLGRDVQAWVEIHVAGGRWVPLYDTMFMPDPSKRPDQAPPQQVQNADTAAVPPPRTVRSHTTGAEPGSGTVVQEPPPPCPPAAASGSATDPRCRVPNRNCELCSVLTTTAYAGMPLAVLFLIVGGIAGLKARRRFLRRTRGVPANRVAAGWQELVDRARELGMAPPAGTTRRHQALAIGLRQAPDLARDADAVVYGDGDPTEEQIAGYWQRVSDASRAMRGRASRRRRLIAAFTIDTRHPLRALPGRSPR